MSIETSHARKPWIASALSLLCPGLGQLYCGQIARGLMFFCGSLVAVPVVVLLAIFASRTPILIAFFASLLGLIVLAVWSVRDARIIARRMAGTDYQPKDFNHPVVYTLMIFSSGPYALGLALFLRATVVEAFVVPTSSMAPTIIPGDRILVTKLGLDTATFQRGDVVVFRNPNNRTQKFVKRIIGLPGETVEIKDNTVIINGQPLEKTPSPPANGEPHSDKGQTFIEKTGEARHLIQIDKPDVASNLPPVKVAPDAYFVLGDHRDLSRDSREVGSVPHGLMIGVVHSIYYPAGSWQRFGPPR